MGSELVSVVIPTYNYGRFLPDAVRSVLEQTYPHVEVIVADDGSTDDTRDRLAPFMDRIRYLPLENQGPSAARNTAIRAARGDLVALLDADDFWHPHKLTLQVRYLEQHPDVALVASDAVHDVAHGWPPLPDREELPAEVVSLENLVLKARFAPSSVLLRRKVFDAVGDFDARLRYAEDRDLWIRIAARYQVARLGVPLCLYRLHGGGLSVHAQRMEEGEVQVVHTTFAKLPALRGRFLLKRKALAFAAHDAAYRYGAAGCWGPALGRMMRSFALWPLPYRQRDADVFAARPRRFLVALLRMLHIKRPDPGPGALPLQALPPA